VHQVSMFIHCK